MGKTSNKFIKAGNQPRITGSTTSPKSKGNVDTNFMRQRQPKFTGAVKSPGNRDGGPVNLDPTGITTK